MESEREYRTLLFKRLSFAVLSIVITAIVGLLIQSTLRELMPALIAVCIILGIQIILSSVIPVFLQKKNKDKFLSTETTIHCNYLRNIARENEMSPEEFETILRMLFFDEDKFDYENSVLRIVLTFGRYNSNEGGLSTKTEHVNECRNGLVVNQFSVLCSKKAIRFINTDSMDEEESFIISSDILLWASNFINHQTYSTFTEKDMY